MFYIVLKEDSLVFSNSEVYAYDINDGIFNFFTSKGRFHIPVSSVSYVQITDD